MNILILDTETNGLPQKWGSDPKDFHLFPEILSIAYTTWNTDTDEVMEHYHVIDRPIVKWDKYAMEVNGFSEDKLKSEGKKWEDIMSEFELILNRTDLISCHNVDFDLPILEADLTRNKECTTVLKFPTYCTMKQTTDLCKIPSPRGRGYKWPKLDELHKFLFDSPMEDHFNAHNALEDVRCTLKCLKKLVEIGHIQLNTFA